MSIQNLIEEVLEICKDPRFVILKKEPNDVRIYVNLIRPFLLKHLNVDLKEYYFDPKTALETKLKWMILRYRELSDDTIMKPEIGVDYGMALEPSLFGVKPIFDPVFDAAMGDPVINRYQDLENLKYPDFFTSGLMPDLHRMYRGVQELVEGKLRVTFPGWDRGAWSTACYIRGYENLFIDIIDDPNFSHQLLEFTKASQIKWAKDRGKFLNEKISAETYYIYDGIGWDVFCSDNYDDEIAGLSPKMFEDFVLPYEKQLAEFYGGTHYFHACTDLIPIIDMLKELPGQKVFHVNAWTDLKAAREKLDTQVIFQVRLAPKDMVTLNNAEWKANLSRILEEGRGAKIQIVADMLGPVSFEKVKTWIEIAREVIADKCEAGR